MVNNRLADPTQVGVEGLSGLNTKSGARRYLKDLGFADSLQEYKDIRKIRPTESPVQEVGFVGIGNSRFDKKIESLTQFNDLEDTRSDIQPWTAKVGAGVGKGIVLAGTTLADGWLGLLAGAINGIGEAAGIADPNLNGWQNFWHGFWNNPFSQAMKEVNDWSEQALPNYMSVEERENIANGEGYKNMFNANWWGNSFLKNLGFAVGAYYSGAGVSAALKNAPPIIKTITGATISAINEGKKESLDNADEWYNNELYKLNEAYNNELENIEQNYGSLSNYQDYVDRVNASYEAALARLNTDKAKIGNVTLALNIPILTASNWFMWGKLYSGGAKTAINNTSIARRNGKYVTTAYTKALTGPISEGSEEVGQKIATTIPQIKYSSDIENFYSMRFSPDEASEALDWTKSTMLGISDVVGDPNSWEEFAIGAMTGLLGMPTFRSVKNENGKLQSPIKLEGGIWEAISDTNMEKSMVSELNKRVSDPKFSEYYQGLIRHNKYQKDMNNAALNGDVFNYKNAEDSQLISDIVLFANAGRLQDIENKVNEVFNTSDENISKVVEYTTDSNGNGPFSVEGNVKPKEYIVKSLEDQKNNILKAISNYRETKDYIDNILAGSNTNLKNEEIEELIWLKSKSEAWNDRFNTLSEEVKQKFRTIVAGYKIHNPERTDIIDTISELLTQDNSSLQEILSNKKNDESVNALKTISKSLSSAYNLDWRDLGQDIKDLSLLAEYKDKADTKLIGYITNLKNLQDDIINEKAKIDSENNKRDHKAALDKVNKATTLGSIEQMINSGDVSSEDVNEGFSDTAKTYNKSKLFREKALEYIDANFKDEYKKIAKDAIIKRFNESSNYNDLSNSNLNTTFGVEYTILDSKNKDTFEHDFKNLINTIDDLIKQGESIKNDVEVKNPPKGGETVGRDAVTQAPDISNDINLSNVKDVINKSSLLDDVKSELSNSINLIEKELIDFRNTKNPNNARHIRSLINNIYETYNDENIKTLLDRVLDIIKVDSFNPGDSESTLIDNEGNNDSESYPETAVSGVMKAAIPQFDLNAKKDGKLIDFYIEGEDRNVNYSYVYNKLKEPGKDGKNAFEYVNEGNIKVGDKLDIIYESATENNPEIFWLYHNNHLVNALSANSSEEANIIKNSAKEGKNPTVIVTKIMDGKYSYTRTHNRSVKDILTTGNVKLGVMKNGRMVANTDEVIDPVFNSSNSDGKVYILLPNSRGTLSPKNVQIVHFNPIEFNLNSVGAANPIARDVEKILMNLTELSNKKTEELESLLDNIYLDMIETFYIPDSFHIDVQVKMNGSSYLRIGYNNRSGSRVQENILIKNANSKPIFSIAESVESKNKDIDLNELYSSIRTAIENANLAFNVSAKKLTESKSKEYVNKLVDSGVLRTYLDSDRMRGTWFLLNEKPNTHQSSEYFEAQKNEREGRNTTRVSNINGKEYTVINGIVYTQDGKVATLDNETENLILDLANAIDTYGNNLYGINQHAGWVLINDKKGKRAIDRTQNKYLNSDQISILEDKLSNRISNSEKSKIAIGTFIKNQNNILRTEDGSPKTDTGYYEILEEDGNYHKYDRVHSVIGSNYIGETSGNAATGFGSIVDELVRQFFNSPNTLKRPDNMSKEAYDNLMKSLGIFKAEAEANGIKIITDRMVVYHKYPDGRRVAGELDMLAYNEYTGNISILDVKTSKYSTKSSGFTNVLPKQTRSTKDQYTLQLSAYSKLFEDTYNFKISKLTLLPFQISYSDGVLKTLKAEDKIRLDYNKDVFYGKISEKLVPGQFVTTSSGIVKYHKTMLKPILGYGDNTYYLTEDNTRLITPNGRSMRLPEGFISKDMDDNDIRVKLINSINFEELQEKAKGNYLDKSPYGNSVLIQKDADEIVSKGIEAARILEELKPKGKTIEMKSNESSEKRNSDVKLNVNTSLGKAVLSKKSWNELNNDEKSIIMSSFPGASELDIQKFWDDIDSIQREKIVSCP